MRSTGDSVLMTRGGMIRRELSKADKGKVFRVTLAESEPREMKLMQIWRDGTVTFWRPGERALSIRPEEATIEPSLES